MKDAFAECHPAVNFLFYIGALIMGMCLVHPVFLACSLVLSLCYYVIVKKHIVKYFLGMLGLFVGLAAFNPLFNTLGETVLFTYGNSRSYTWEALCYGMALASMFVTVLTWFATYNQVMTSDKFLFCFGRLAPSVTLILTMVLRMVPEFQKKVRQIGGARRCIGMSVENGTTYEKAEHGMTLVSALTSWALEGGVVMADSMRSRGFGCGKRTSFSIYKMRKTDRCLLLCMLILLAVVGISTVNGAAFVTYTPQFRMTGLKDTWTFLGVLAYGMFLAIPTILNVMEELRWHILKSKI